MNSTLIGAAVGGSIGFAVDRLFRTKKTEEDVPMGQPIASPTIKDPTDIKEFDSNIELEINDDLQEFISEFKVYWGNEKHLQLTSLLNSILKQPKTCITLTQKSEKMIDAVKKKYQIKTFLGDLEFSHLTDYNRTKAAELMENLAESLDDAIGNYISDIQLSLS